VQDSREIWIFSPRSCSLLLSLALSCSLLPPTCGVYARMGCGERIICEDTEDTTSILIFCQSEKGYKQMNELCYEIDTTSGSLKRHQHCKGEYTETDSQNRSDCWKEAKRTGRSCFSTTSLDAPGPFQCKIYDVCPVSDGTPETLPCAVGSDCHKDSAPCHFPGPSGMKLCAFD